MAGPWSTSHGVEVVINSANRSLSLSIVVCLSSSAALFCCLLLLCCAAADLEGEARRNCDIYKSGHTSQHHHSTATGKCLCVCHSQLVHVVFVWVSMYCYLFVCVSICMNLGLDVCEYISVIIEGAVFCGSGSEPSR